MTAPLRGELEPPMRQPSQGAVRGGRMRTCLKEVPLPLSRGAGIRNAKVGRPGATCGMPSAMG